MSTPLTVAAYLAALKKWNVPFKPYHDNWATHNRAGHGGWGPVNGVMLHHTGSDGDARQTLWAGRGLGTPDELPGPLCQAANDQRGTVWGIGWGRANHAGLGDPRTLAHVVAEDYQGQLHPQHNSVDGNSHFYGMEVEYAGTHGMNRSQYHSMILWAAALCDAHGWKAESVIAHAEWQVGKWDPGYAKGRVMDMNAVRNDVRAYLKSGPAKLPA